MPNFICTTCGTQFAESQETPEECTICQDDRQYVGWGGQQWTTSDVLRKTHRNTLKQEEPGLIGIGMGHYHGWLMVTPQGITDWAGETAVQLQGDERYYVVIGALCEGRYATFDTDTSDLVPFNLAK